MRARLGWWLRCLADRIDPDHAFRRFTAGTLTIEKGLGWFLRDTGQGLPVWYLPDDYDKAYDGADNPPVQIDWSTLQARGRSRG